MPVYPPDPLSTRNRADLLRIAIDRQHRRSARRVPGDPLSKGPLWSRTVVERMNDTDFMVVALWRLQLLAEWAASAAWATPALRAEVRRFKTTVPHLQQIRDTQEHFDKYGAGIGRRQTRKGESPSGWGYGHSTLGMMLTYGRFNLDLTTAIHAARDLHRAIRMAVDPLASRDVHGGRESVIVERP